MYTAGTCYWPDLTNLLSCSQEMLENVSYRRCGQNGWTWRTSLWCGFIWLVHSLYCMALWIQNGHRWLLNGKHMQQHHTRYFWYCNNTEVRALLSKSFLTACSPLWPYDDTQGEKGYVQARSFINMHRVYFPAGIPMFILSKGIKKDLICRHRQQCDWENT